MNGPLGGRRLGQVPQSATATSAALLGRPARVLGAFSGQGTPDNEARDCWACAHPWHGLSCRNSICPCETSWVDPENIRESA